MINGIAKYTKDDGINYCKGNNCKSCKLKEEVCINEDGLLKVKYHTEFEDFQHSFNVMMEEITINKAVIF